VEGALRSSNCLRAHHSRNRRVLRRLLPLLPPTPTIAGKVRVRAREREKARIIALTAPATTAMTIAGVPQRGPPAIPESAPSQYGQGCVLRSSSWRVHHNTPCSLHQHTMGFRRSLLHALVGFSTTPAASRSPYLVALDGPLGSVVIGQLLQHHGLDSLGDHRLGRKLRRLQPHHLGCR
jgi:hypothetical protein